MYPSQSVFHRFKNKCNVEFEFFNCRSKSTTEWAAESVSRAMPYQFHLLDVKISQVKDATNY